VRDVERTQKRVDTFVLEYGLKAARNSGLLLAQEMPQLSPSNPMGLGKNYGIVSPQSWSVAFAMHRSAHWMWRGPAGGGAGKLLLLEYTVLHPFGFASLGTVPNVASLKFTVGEAELPPFSSMWQLKSKQTTAALGEAMLERLNRDMLTFLASGAN